MSQADLLNHLQAKMAQLQQKPSAYLPSLPQTQKKKLVALQHLNSQRKKHETKLEAEIRELEKKYQTQYYDPIYARRKEIVNGDAEPTEEEMVYEGEDRADQMTTKIEEIAEDESSPSKPSEDNKASEDAKGIPSFWFTALTSHPHLAEMITDEDAKALHHLVDLRLKYLDEEQGGFQLEFEFSENPVFSNNVLVKTYHHSTDDNGTIMFDRSEGTPIDWKEGQCLTHEIEMKKQRHKASGKTRTVKKSVEVPSFFHFFSPPTLEKMMEESGNDDNDEEEDLRERQEVDYDIGELIKEKIIPNAIDWFTGVALEEEDFGDEEEEGFYDNQYEDDEDDDDEDDDEDEDEGQANPSGAGGPPQEQCKQQ